MSSYIHKSGKIRSGLSFYSSSASLKDNILQHFCINIKWNVSSIDLKSVCVTLWLGWLSFLLFLQIATACSHHLHVYNILCDTQPLLCSPHFVCSMNVRWQPNKTITCEHCRFPLAPQGIPSTAGDPFVMVPFSLPRAENHFISNQWGPCDHYLSPHLEWLQSWQGGRFCV